MSNVSIGGQDAVQILDSREVSTLFTEVEPEELLPHLVPWFITRQDKEKILAHRKQTGDKAIAVSNLLGKIVEAFEQRQDISLQDVIDALKKTEKYPKLISTLEKAQFKDGTKALVKLGCADLVTKLKDCYLDELSSFKPLSFDEIIFDFDHIWINLQLENTADLTAPEIDDCIDCLNVAFQKRKVDICKGEPGTGKSTLSTYLCYKWAKEEWKECQFDLVFLVQLRELFGREVNTIAEAVVNVSKSYQMLSDQLCSLEQILKSSSKCLVIVDGYDEAMTVCTQLQSVLLNETKGLPFHILVTSRPWAVADTKCPAQVFKICALTDGQRTEYITNHFAQIGKAIVGDALLEVLKRKPVLKKLSETALILCYLCFYYANCKTVENNIDSLTSMYLHIVACLIDRYQTDKLPSRMKKPFGSCWLQSKIVFFLGKMALFGLASVPYMAGTTQTSFTKSDIERFTVDVNACTSAGLLVRKSLRIAVLATESTYIYPHLTMQEFCASLFVLRCYLEIEDEKKRRVQLEEFKTRHSIDSWKAQNILSTILELDISANFPNSSDATAAAILELPKLWGFCVYNWCSEHESAIINFIQKIKNPSLESRMICCINEMVVDRLCKFSPIFSDKSFLQFCNPYDLPLFRVKNHSNWCYNSDRNTLYYGHEPFKEILHQCRQLSFDELKQPINVIFFYQDSFSELNNLLSGNLVVVNEIINGQDSYLSLSVPEMTKSKRNEAGNKCLHVSKVEIVYEDKLIDEIGLKKLYDSFLEWICSLDENTKSQINCIHPILRDINKINFLDIDSCVKLSRNFPHLSILEIRCRLEDLARNNEEFLQCWSYFENLKIVEIFNLYKIHMLQPKAFESFQDVLKVMPNLETVVVHVSSTNKLILDAKKILDVTFDGFLGLIMNKSLNL